MPPDRRSQDGGPSPEAGPPSGPPSDPPPFYAHAIEAEQALIGALLIRNEALEALGPLEPDQFSDDTHGRIFRLIQRMVREGHQVTPKTVQGIVSVPGDIGGREYIARLASGAVTTAPGMVAGYAEAIRRAWRQREAHHLGDTIKTDVETGVFDPARIRRALDRLEARPQGGPEPFIKAVRGAAEGAQSVSKGDGGVRYALPALERFLGPLLPYYYLIGARPSMGKSALLMHMAVSAARAGSKVLIFSLEMRKNALGERALSAVSGVPYEDIGRGRLTGDDLARVVEAQSEYDGLPLWIDDTRGLRASELRHRARRHQNDHGLDVLFVDYLQLVRPEERYRGQRVAEITEISGEFAQLVGDLGIPVVVLSQLSRQVEQRDDKRPSLADLRESGALEQDADVVMFLYRSAYYLERNEPPAGSVKHADWQADVEACRHDLEAIVAKRRQGRTGTVTLWTDLALCRFR